MLNVHLYLPGNIAPLIVMLIFGSSFCLKIILYFIQNWRSIMKPEFIFEITFAIMVIVYSTLAIKTPTDPFNNRLLPYLNLFSWTKGASYLKNFKLTRLFIQIFI
jgi:hypothetical protein